MPNQQRQQKIVLIADPDREVVRTLGNALHEQGYQVRAALDGSKALEKAILTNPDIILFDENCPLISLKKFIQILRSNPRTEDIPLIAMVRQPVDDLSGRGYREAYIQKPFNNDEILSLVAFSLRKMATAQEVRAQAREIEGSLSQISLFDLMQIFHLNRKSGLLELRRGEQQAQLFFKEGSAVHCQLGRHSGEKALFRLLRWREGNFAFIPGRTTNELTLRRSTDTLLLEGARQADEYDHLLAELPAEKQKLRLVGEISGRFEGLHPVTQEILSLLEFYDTVGTLIEHSRVSDYEAGRAIRTLLDKKIVTVISAPTVATEEEVEAPLLEADALYELKVQVAGRLRTSERLTRGKLVLFSVSRDPLKMMLAGLQRLPEAELVEAGQAAGWGFGRLGALHLSDNFLLELELMPVEPHLRPLWAPLGSRAVGALVVAPGGDEQAAYRMELLAGMVGAAFGVPVETLTLPTELPDEAASAKLAPLVRQKLVELLRAIRTPRAA